MNVTINKSMLLNNLSLVDGPGCRSVIFFQGCKFKCNGCHNIASWNINDTSKSLTIEVSQLAEIIRKNTLKEYRMLTISGGEPLLQKEALLELLNLLSDFDICLYTGFEYDDVPKNIIHFLKYLKVGKFQIENICYDRSYVGSTNQKFILVNGGKTYEEIR